MTNYTTREFQVIVQLIIDFNKEHKLRKNGITRTQINKWLFEYPSLMTHVESDIGKVSERRMNKKGLYGRWSIQQITEKLVKAFEIPKEVFAEEKTDFKIDLQVVLALKNKYKTTSVPNHSDKSQVIYLIGSTYQGKQLQVSPRSVFEINLKTKVVIFYYYGTDGQKLVETFTGSLSGTHLVYLSFQDTPYKKMYILKKGRLAWDKVTYLQGAYIGDDDSNPMAGAIFCEKVADYKAASIRIKSNQPVEPGIQFLLLYSQYREKGSVISDSQPLRDFHFMVTARAVKEYFEGTYYGIYLSTKTHHSLITAKLELKGNGSAIFYGDHNQEQGEEGWIYPSETKKAYLRFKYNEKLNIFKYFITLTRINNEGIKYLFGSFGGDSKFSHIPETGRIIFKKIENLESDSPLQFINRIDLKNKQQFEDFRKDDKYGDFHSLAIQFLKGETILNRDNEYTDTPAVLFPNPDLDNFLEKRREESKITHQPSIPSEFVGIYKVYLIHYFGTPPNYRLQRVAIEIRKNNEVEALSSASRRYVGKTVRYGEDGKISFFLSYQDEEPDLYHSLELIRWPGYVDGKVLHGTYTGSGRNAENHPVGGRIIFFKDEKVDNLKGISIKDFDLSNALDMKQLELEEPQLLNFFLGMNDNMMESFGLFKKSGFLPITYTPHHEIRNHISGFYLSFRIRTDLKTISIVPVGIDKWGNVKMKSTQQLNETEFREYSGVCDINDNEILSLRFHSYDGHPLFAHSKFNKSTDIVDDKNNQILMGIFSSSNTKQSRVFSCKQVLIFQNKIPENYDLTIPEIIDIPFFPKSKDGKFKEWNERYQGILDYLIGDEYNMIRMSRGPRISPYENGQGFQKKINYGQVFYFAGLKYFEEGDVSNAEDTWYQAIMNGFHDEEKIKNLEIANTDAWIVFNEIVKRFQPIS